MANRIKAVILAICGLTLLPAAGVPGSGTEITLSDYAGHPAFVMDNGLVELVAVPRFNRILSLRLKPDGENLLWNSMEEVFPAGATTAAPSFFRHRRAHGRKACGRRIRNRTSFPAPMNFEERDCCCACRTLLTTAYASSGSSCWRKASRRLFFRIP